MFIVICAAMLAAALLPVARPLIRDAHSRRVVLPILSILLPALALSLYWRIGHRSWEQDEQTSKLQAAEQRDLVATIRNLERRVHEAPNDVNAVLSLAEALVAQDERAMNGRAGELFETALTLAPDNPKALWYGAINALAAGKLPVARERLERVLTQNPPPQIRSIIERQIQDINQQLGASESSRQAAASSRALNVQVSLAPALMTEVDKATPLFILARDPVKGGPPLAVARRTAGDLPLSVTLSDNDAMVQGRGISSVSRVQVVARISKTGAPLAQAGDLSGEANVDLNDTQPITVKIAIDHKVEK